MAKDDTATAEFDEALKLHADTPAPFERARSELCLGERLRRLGRPGEARGPLRSATLIFDDLGAAPWAARARAELTASGEKVRQASTGPENRLTAQELQVAITVANGATNREAAAALFLSPKTIEYHLHNVYRKLQLRSRSELARRFANVPHLTDEGF